MAYLGSEAYRLDLVEEAHERRPTRPSLDVIEGGGADARARQGVSRSFVTVLGGALAAVSAFALIGAVRVGITTLTVSELSANVALEREIEEAEAANSDLRIERSILSSSARIDRIAVQGYGMVLAAEHDVVTLPMTGAAADAAAKSLAARGLAKDVAVSDDPEAALDDAAA